MSITHVLILLPALVLAAAALVDVLRRDKLDSGTKLGWVIVDLCLPVAGPLAWFVFGRRSARRVSA